MRAIRLLPLLLLSALPLLAQSDDATSAPSRHAPTAPFAVTTITLAKAGNNIAFTWATAGGQSYDGTRATNKAFFSAATLFSANTSGTYTYTGALTNSRVMEYFDITDQTEVNAGAVNNGGVLPPAPPTVNAPPTATLYIGMTTATITGSNFSSVAPDNGIWFSGGVLSHAKTVNGTGTQLTMEVPPGALSGPITVSRQNSQASDSANGDVYLEDPAAVSPDNWTAIRSIGFAKSTGDYWTAGAVNAVNGVFRQFYDTTSKKWLKENRSGTFGGTLVCATQSDRFGRIYCTVNSTTTSGTVATRFAGTNPPADLANCRGLSGSPFSVVGDTVLGLAAATDPNPNAVAGRDVAYFIAQNNSSGKTCIFKVGVDATGCISTLDRDYGNRNCGWGASNPGGLAVDLDGSVYIALSNGTIERILLDESHSPIKSGLITTRGIDVRQDVAGGPVHFLTTEFSTTPGASKVNWFSTDNPDPPRQVLNGVSIRAVTWGATVTGPATSLVGDTGKLPEVPAVLLQRNTVVANNGIAIPVYPDPRILVTPATPEEGRVWISSPGSDQNDKGPFQVQMRPSVNAQPWEYSTVTVTATFSDNILRMVCARSSDPITSAPYDATPPPASLQNCGRAWGDVNAVCDNLEGFVSGGQGSFIENDGFEYCPSTPCGSSFSPCRARLRIGQRFAGDNYRVLFHAAGDPEKRVIASTGPISAWKHQHIERAATCNRGALLYRDYGATGQCGGVGQPACCGVGGEPACNTLRVFSTTTLLNGDTVRVFSEVAGQRYVNGDARTVVGNPLDSGLGYSTVTLDAPLARSYFATSLDGSSLLPVFTNQHAAGACFTGAALFSADISNLQSTANDAYINYDPTDPAPEIVPHYGSVMVHPNLNVVMHRFSRIWHDSCLKDDVNGNQTDCFDNNVLHLVGMEQTGAPGYYGSTNHKGNSSLVFQGATMTANATRSTTRHEIVGHQHEVNPCDLRYHDTNSAWCDSPGHCGIGGAVVVQCLMSETRDRELGVDRLDQRDMMTGIAATCTDTQIVPNEVHNPPDGSIRKDRDPR